MITEEVPSDSTQETIFRSAGISRTTSDLNINLSGLTHISAKKENSSDHFVSNSRCKIADSGKMNLGTLATIIKTVTRSEDTLHHSSRDEMRTLGSPAKTSAAEITDSSKDLGRPRHRASNAQLSVSTMSVFTQTTGKTHIKRLATWRLRCVSALPPMIVSLRTCTQGRR